MIAIGLGCRSGCKAEEIVMLVRQAIDALRHPYGEERRPPHHEAPECRAADPASALFTIVDKRGEPGLDEAATILGLPLVFLEAEALRRVAGSAMTVSPRVEALHGLPSVAETAALAGAGEGAALLAPRISSRHATCAIAGPRR